MNGCTLTARYFLTVTNIRPTNHNIAWNSTQNIYSTTLELELIWTSNWICEQIKNQYYILWNVEIIESISLRQLKFALAFI
jgi:hypothetical protein